MIRTSLNSVLLLITLVTLGACSADDVGEGQSTTIANLEVTSAAVSSGELLEAFKCEEKVDGAEASIPVAWSVVPETAGSVAVIMHHYPNADDESEVNSYLLLWDIPAEITSIAHGAGDDGPWLMGADKDGRTISYTSPCSPSAGIHEYTITVYALSETPASLPTESTAEVDYWTLKEAIETVEILGTGTLTFNDINE